MPSVSEAKGRLRADAKSRRRSITDEVRQSAAPALARHVTALLNRTTVKAVSGFLSFGDEIDTGLLLERLHRDGYSLCLPVMQGRDKPLLFRAWAPGDVLATVQWGIQEPTADKALLEPDALFVPLLAFDGAGNRLGYGGGYYDRTIQALAARKPVVTIGVAFDEQRVDAVPHLDYDQRLDWVLTPSGPLSCMG